MNLTGKQKSQLRSLAQTQKAVFHVGKEGLTKKILEQISVYLDKHELGKISLLDTCITDKAEIIDKLNIENIEVIERIGKVMVLYRPNPALKKRIELKP